MGGSVGVGVAFGLTGDAAGFSTDAAGFVSCEKEIWAANKMIAPGTMNLRKNMETKGRRKNLRLSSRVDLQRKPRRVDGTDYGFSNESNAKKKCFGT
jgi:hypothetical protein